MGGLRRVDPWIRLVKHITLPDDPDGCFELNLVGPCGYPSISMTDETGSRLVRGNRAAWMLFFGAIPEGKYILHTCDNKKCVRPDHLYVGDARDNIMDAINRGRFTSPKGEKQGISKLTGKDITDIRCRHRQGLVSQRELADEYKLSPSWVSRIVNNKSWRHIHAA
jgi:hypothetical protein